MTRHHLEDIINDLAATLRTHNLKHCLDTSKAAHDADTDGQPPAWRPRDTPPSTTELTTVEATAQRRIDQPNPDYAQAVHHIQQLTIAAAWLTGFTRRWTDTPRPPKQTHCLGGVYHQPADDGHCDICRREWPCRTEQATGWWSPCDMAYDATLERCPSCNLAAGHWICSDCLEVKQRQKGKTGDPIRKGRCTTCDTAHRRNQQ